MSVPRQPRASSWVGREYPRCEWTDPLNKTQRPGGEHDGTILTLSFYDSLQIEQLFSGLFNSMEPNRVGQNAMMITSTSKTKDNLRLKEIHCSASWFGDILTKSILTL